MLVHDQHQDFAVSQSYDYCMLTQYFDAKLRSVGEPPPDCPEIFLTGKCKKSLPLPRRKCRGPWFQWSMAIQDSSGDHRCSAGNMLTPQRNCIRRYLGRTWLVIFGSPALKIEVPSHWGPQQKSPVGRILMVPQLGEAQVIWGLDIDRTLCWQTWGRDLQAVKTQRQGERWSMWEFFSLVRHTSDIWEPSTLIHFPSSKETRVPFQPLPKFGTLKLHDTRGPTESIWVQEQDATWVGKAAQSLGPQADLQAIWD